MSFLNDFSQNAKSCVGSVSRKADAAVEISRLKITERSLQRDISKSLKLLGAKVYKAYSADDAEVDVKSDVTAVRDMYDRLRTVRLEIKRLKAVEFASDNSDSSFYKDKVKTSRNSYKDAADDGNSQEQ